MSVHIFGIRHHGPGSARSLLNALEALQPDALLVEGPPEAEGILQMAADPAMEPPVALLVYAVEDLKRAVFYPFALYSPEWQAIHYGLRHGIHLSFFDLPQSHWLALEKEEPEGEGEVPLPSARDPLDLLAEAAGLEDGERWWEQLVEERSGDETVFQAIQEAMTALREEGGFPGQGGRLEELREAAMRARVRQAEKDGYQRIAVVCGAWHAPALQDLSGEKKDAETLKKMKQVKVNSTWVPWTYGHLTFASGYGAGVRSPAWYGYLWSNLGQVGPRWLSRAAELLREEDLDASPAQVVDAQRLAEALAAMRGRSRPGLSELDQAALTVFCFGDVLPMELIARKLVVGEILGQVPPDAPAVPLQQDLTAQQRRLRLPPDPEEKVIDIDLRKSNGLERSALLHRLALLGIPWGQLEPVRGVKGTFHEIWMLRWDPLFAVVLVEASVWGNTVAEAAAALSCDRARKAETLAQVTALLDKVLLADLPGAIEEVVGVLGARMAVSGDVSGMMEALPHLARALRYGTVRDTSGARALDAAGLEKVFRGLATRVCIGLAGACASLDDEAARQMLERIEKVHEGLHTAGDADALVEWTRALAALADQRGLHGLLAGRACRILHDGGNLPAEEIARRLSQSLSPGNPPADGANWLEGLLRGSGLLLLHDYALWGAVDTWLEEMPLDTFETTLPLLRRTFSMFPAPERRQLGQLAARGRGSLQERLSDETLDPARADGVLPLARLILGLSDGEEST